MKAYVLNAVNQLDYMEKELPQLFDGWVLVKVMASSICSSDIARIFYKGTYTYPTIPGHEFSGVVYKTSNNVSKKWIGKKVGIFPLIPCKKCHQCQKKEYALCESYDYIGSRRDGAFAEYVAVPEWNLIELNDDVDFKTASLLEPLTVSQHAYNVISHEASKSIAIVGTGAIAFMIAMWAKENGYKVTIIGQNKNKEELASKLGIKYTMECDTSYDVVFECVGTEKSIEKSISIIQAKGTLVLVGNPEGDITLHQNIYWKILRKELTIKGVWNSKYDSITSSEWDESVKFLKKNNKDLLQLITHVFESKDLKTALNIMKEHTEPYCRIVITWN